MVRYSWLRWRTGQLTLWRDRNLGRWAAQQAKRLRPQRCYLFTQVALETLRWARREGVPTAVDNPNGHIRNFQQVCDSESLRWFGKRFPGHPSPAMIERVEEEYQLADRIRVYSEWGKASMVQHGVLAHKIHVLRPTINLERFRPPESKHGPRGPLRVCYAGSLDLRKGFVYLLRAIRAVGAKHFQLQIVGATGDRNCARLFARETAGLHVDCAPGNPLPAYQQAELFVLPTLEDGFGLVVLEGMACGLPAIVTDQAGAAECVRPGETGWVVEAGQVEPLAAALEDALARREELPSWGARARTDAERYVGQVQLQRLCDWFDAQAGVEVGS
jgi:glycosyltransferase involved in cell wall biosynthesis